MEGRVGSALAGLLVGWSGIAARAESVGPEGWTLRNWIGFFLYLFVFLLVVIGLYRMAVSDDAEARKEEGAVKPAPDSAKDEKKP